MIFISDRFQDIKFSVVTQNSLKNKNGQLLIQFLDSVTSK